MAGSKGFEFIQYGAGSDKSDLAPQKLVFTFHGYGRNAHFMKKLALEIEQTFPAAAVIGMHAPEQLDLPDRLGVSDMNMPQELVNEDGTLSKDMQRQWFSMRGGMIRIWWRLWRLQSRVNRFVDEQKNQYNLNDHDICFVGFSQGGAVALYSALRRKYGLSCVVAHSTAYWGKMPIRSRPPVYLLYGDKDDSISQDLYKQSEIRLENAGLKPDVTRFANQGHYISTKSRQKVIDILSGYLA